MTTRIPLLAALWLALFAGTALAASPDMASALVKDTSQRMIKTLEQRRAEIDRDQTLIYKLVGEILVPHFDFEGITQSAVGRYWGEATPAQRKTLTVAFQELLVRTYATALLKYNDEEIFYLPFRSSPDDRTATVRSEVRRKDGGPPIAIQYSFYRTDNVWKVYDVTIEGASLVSTYQTTYAARVQKEGLDALIASLARDNKAAASGKTASNGGKAGGKAGATP